MLAHLSHKLASWLGEPFDVGTHVESPTLAKINEFLQTYALTTLLPYEAYDDESGLYYNRASIGFVLEASPLSGATEETITILNGLIADSLPTGATLQVLLWSSPKIGNPLEAWRAERIHHGPMFEMLANQRVRYLEKGAFCSLIKNDAFLVRNFRLLFSVVMPANVNVKEELITFRDQLLSTCKSASINSQALSIDGFLSVLRDLINPNSEAQESAAIWNQHMSIAGQVVNPETNLQVTNEALIFNENEGDVRTFTVKDFPKHWAAWGMGDLIGDTYRDTLRIPCPFLINFIIHCPDREKAAQKAAIKGVRADQRANSPLARFIPSVGKVARDWKFANARLEEGDRLVECFYQVVLFAPMGQGNRCETVLKNLYNAKGWKLRKPKYLQLQSWLAMLPMIMGEGLLDDLRRFGRLTTLPSFTATNLLPLQAEWKGMPTPRMLLVGRRGQMLWWDPFDNEEGNYNVAVVGKSGSGKSVFMQELLVSLVGSGGRVWVIDIGRSFQKTCEMLGGDFIEFTPISNICINPFTFIGDFEESLAMLKPLFAIMARPSTRTTDHENALLEQALKAAWVNAQNAATVTHVAQWLLAHDDVRAKDLGTMLFPYTNEGMYGRFFEGRCTLDTQNPLTVLELEELKSKKDFQEVVLLILIYQVTETMYRGDRLQRIACILDELSEHLRGEQAKDFIDTAARRARKYRGSLITGTQTVNDYYKTPAAQAALDNSDWICLLSQKPESIDELKERKRLHLDGHMERMLKSVKTVQGVYAEVMIYGPHGFAIGRLMLDPFSRILYSSKGQEFAAVRQLQQQGLSLTDAVQHIAERVSHDAR